jgi:hypothetical protein
LLTSGAAALALFDLMEQATATGLYARGRGKTGIRMSMDGCGRWIDNVFIERCDVA